MIPNSINDSNRLLIQNVTERRNENLHIIIGFHIRVDSVCPGGNIISGSRYSDATVVGSTCGQAARF